MKVSEYIALFLKTQEVSHVFEMSGGMITHLLDAIYNLGYTNIVSMHHEQAAAFAVDGYSRVSSRKFGVALATSGPGATNLITGIASCYFDSVPGIFITGQVNQNEQKGTKNIRQLGFQETDIVNMTKHITKASYLITSPSEIPKVLNEAIQLIHEGRPGPVLIDIPMNIQSSEIIEDPSSKARLVSNHGTKISDDFLSSFWEDFAKSKKPLVLAGRGVIAGGSKDKFKEWIEAMKIPTVFSLLGLGSLPSFHKYHIGMIGTYGNRWANHAIGECDLLIVLGSRLDIRQTGADVGFFAKNRTIYHIDIDPNEINNRVRNCVGCNCSVGTFLSATSQNEIQIHRDESWIQQINTWKTQWADDKENKNCIGINPNKFVKLLSTAAQDDSIFLADVGSHQMWVAQSLRLKEKQQFITSGGAGAMGYALPASIGAYFSLNQPVVSISGDGGMQLNIQELQTISHHNLPIKIIVVNNHSLGMIRQFQDSYFNGRYQSTVWGYSCPDFVKLSKAYNIDSISISKEDEIENGLDMLFKDKDKPFLLEVVIDKSTNVFPKIAFGRPINEMEPEFESIEIEST